MIYCDNPEIGDAEAYLPVIKCGWGIPCLMVDTSHKHGDFGYGPSTYFNSSDSGHFLGAQAAPGDLYRWFFNHVFFFFSRYSTMITCGGKKNTW